MGTEMREELGEGNMIKNIVCKFFNQKLYVPFKGSETAYCLQIIQFSYLSSLCICEAVYVLYVVSLCVHVEARV